MGPIWDQCGSHMKMGLMWDPCGHPGREVGQTVVISKRGQSMASWETGRNFSGRGQTLTLYERGREVRWAAFSSRRNNLIEFIVDSFWHSIRLPNSKRVLSRLRDYNAGTGPGLYIAFSMRVCCQTIHLRQINIFVMIEIRQFLIIWHQSTFHP